MKVIFRISLFFLSIMGGVAMSFIENRYEFFWEWRADRAIVKKVVAELILIESRKPLINTPSFASNLPDPIRLIGKFFKNNSFSDKPELELVAPRFELPDMDVGDRFALGLINDSTCVCIEKVPSKIQFEDLDRWLEDWECE